MKNNKKIRFVSVVLALSLTCQPVGFIGDNGYMTAKAVAKKGLNKTKLTILSGKSKKLKLNGDKIKSIKCSKPAIVKVNKKGILTGKSSGNAKVTVIGNSGKKYNCKVTVKARLNYSNKTLKNGQSFKLKLIGLGVKKISSSNTKVVLVNRSGKVKAVGVGKADITVKAVDKKKYVCRINVKKNDNNLYPSTQQAVSNNMGENNIYLQAGNIAYYTITFESNGGSKVDSQRVKVGDLAIKPADPVYNNYMFKGWYSDVALSNVFDFTQAINSDITLYAKWVEDIPLLSQEVFENVVVDIGNCVGDIEAGLVDDNGEFEKIDDVHTAVNNMYNKLKNQEIYSEIDRVIKSNDNTSVTIILKDKTGLIYSPHLKDTYSGAGNDYTVSFVSTLGGLESFNNDLLGGHDGLESADYIVYSVEEYVKTCDIKDIFPQLQEDGLKELQTFLGDINNYNSRVFLWNGHGNTVYGTNIGFEVYQKNAYSEAVRKTWKNQLQNGELFICVDNYSKKDKAIAEKLYGNEVIVTDKFFDSNLPKVNGGIFISGSCWGFYNDSMANVIKKHGFDAYLGFSSSVDVNYSNNLIYEIAKNLCAIDKDEYPEEYITLNEAIERAIEEKGDTDKDGTYLKYWIRDEGNKKKEFRLVPLDQYYFRGTVTCYDVNTSTQRPLSDVSVEVYRLEDGQYKNVGKTKSNEDGIYSFLGLYAGKYVFSLKKPGYKELSFEYTISKKKTNELSVIMDDDFHTLNFNIISKKDSKPVSNAKIFIEKQRDNDNYEILTYDAKTNINGSIDIERLKVGKYIITVSCNGYETYQEVFNLTDEANEKINKTIVLNEKYEDNIFSNPITSNGVTTWDCIQFGRYIQNGKSKEPIKWRVLSVNGNDAFLIADTNLDTHCYHDSTEDGVTWGDSDIRSWLNSTFFTSAFNDSEQDAIIKTKVVNNNNPTYGTAGGIDTEDKIYLLSLEEVMNTKYGFTSDDESTPTRESINTEYVASGGSNSTQAMEEAGSADFWWLRSSGNDSCFAANVDYDGSVYAFGDEVRDDNFAVRPVLHLDLKKVDMYKAAGTVSSDGEVSNKLICELAK